MQQRRPWQPWEYRALHEGCDLEEVARALDRDLEEVERRSMADLGDWYRRRRCRWTPRRPDRVMKLARKIWREDYRHLLEEGDLQNVVILTLSFCFEHFDPTRGDRSLPVRVRFMRYFALWFKRRLWDIKRNERRARKRRKRARRAYGEALAAREAGVASPDTYMEWRRHLYDQALRRLDRTTQEYVKLCFVQGKGAEASGRLLGIPERTRCRRYGFDRVVEIVRREIRRMVMEAHGADRDRLIYTLRFTQEFSEDEIAGLLCLPTFLVEELVGDVASREVVPDAREELWHLFGGLESLAM